MKNNWFGKSLADVVIKMSAPLRFNDSHLWLEVRAASKEKCFIRVFWLTVSCFQTVVVKDFTFTIWLYTWVKQQDGARSQYDNCNTQ